MSKAEEIEQLKQLNESEQAELTGERPKQKGPPAFLTLGQIRRRKRNEENIVKTGIHRLDKALGGGVNRGELTVVTGSSSAGKSSFDSNAAVEAVEQGRTVVNFSGEMPDWKTAEWFQLQAAGKANVRPTKYEGCYYVPDGIREKICKWAQGKYYIYNNLRGLKDTEVIGCIKRFLDKIRTHIVIVDNMMILADSGANGDKYERQAALTLGLSNMAKEYNTHVFFIVHPRKSLSFLRKNDVSGTADIINIADNCMILHRVNRDFIKQSREFFGFNDNHPLYTTGYSNIIEIAKNRDLGNQDILVGTYFEPESKRFLNEKDEVKVYGWEEKQGIQAELNAAEYNGEIPF